MTVISGLGEPLRAEIELLPTNPEEMASLTAAIAPEEAYAVQGIERSALQGTIKVEVGKKPNGNPILKLSTNQAVSDPFLDMLIQVDWATGRLLREYTVLLDPPGYSQQAAMPSIGAGPAVNESTRDSTSAIAPAAPLEKKSKGSGTRSSRKSAKSAVATPTQENASSQDNTATAENTNAEDHTTVRGDTLSTIAAQMQVEGVNLEQMLVGLYRANKGAFVGGNMNRLKVGQIIHAPTPEELHSISRKDARVEIHAQAADWNAYRNKLAGIVAASPASGEDAGNQAQAAGGKITAPAEDKAAPAVSGARDVVKLSKSDSGAASKTNAADAKAMQDKLTALQEEVTARENSVKEANDRTAALEKQVADMQKLLTVKNQAMADMQKSAAAQAPVAKIENAEVAKPAPAAEAPKPEATPAAKAEEPATPASAPAATTPLPAPSAETKAADQPVKKKPVVVPPPAPVEVGFFDGLLQDPLLLEIAGGVLVLLGGAWLFLRNRRRQGLDSFEQGILTSGGLKANTVFGNTAGSTLDTGDTSFLTDFSQSSSGGMIDTHDVDPIAEAEVYMAYGRDTQAEEILKDAIAKEPKRYELHLKLLEIFAGRNDTSAFETIAGELYSTLGSADPTWIKVAEMGRKLEPDNPLYDTSSVSINTAAPAASKNLDAGDFANAEVLSESSLDFSLGSDTKTEASAKAAHQPDADSGLDFDLGMNTQTPAAEMQAFPEINMPAESSSILSAEAPPQANDLDFQLDFPSQATENETKATGTQPLNENTVQLDMSDFGHTMPGFSMPEFSTQKPAVAENAAELPTMPPLETNAGPSLDEISFDFPEIPGQTESPELHDFDKTAIIQPTANAQKNIPEVMSESSGGLDFNLDLPDTAAKNHVATVAETDINKAEAIDLSGISFDFDNTSDMVVEEVNMVSDESSDVETKLDLVAAYMDMGDSEGARELLDEVLKEGGTRQRERAQHMLNNLG